MVAWGRLDLSTAKAFRPWFLPRPWHLELTPEIVARLPLLGGLNFSKPANPRIVNSVRLSVPELDLFAFRNRSYMTGTAQDTPVRAQTIPEDAPVSGGMHSVPVPPRPDTYTRVSAQQLSPHNSSRHHRSKEDRSSRRHRRRRDSRSSVSPSDFSICVPLKYF